MNPKIKHREHFEIFLACTLSYFTLDISVRLTDFLKFGESIGIKNFLAAILGLEFGPFGVAGCCIGCILASIGSGELSIYTFYECIVTIVIGIGMWLLWYLNEKKGDVFLKTPKEYLKYILLLFVLSVVAGIISLIVLSEHTFMIYFAAYFIIGIVVGIPVLILLTSIFCVKAIRPPWVRDVGYYRGNLTGDTASLSILNEELDDYAMLYGVKMRELFGVQNCIEEVYIRIKEALPDFKANVSVGFHNSVDIEFEYPGDKFSPFKRKKGGSDEDHIGLKLIMHRALRASHRYYDKTNFVHIVM